MVSAKDWLWKLSYVDSYFLMWAGNLMSWYIVFEGLRSGFISENWQNDGICMYILTIYFCGRFSVSNDLKYDAERDLRDIGAKNILVHSLNKVWKFSISVGHSLNVDSCVIRE